MPIDYKDLIENIQSQNYLLSAHASFRAGQRAIDSKEIEETVLNGEVIEDYPTDKYGPSCLILGVSETGRILHIQVSYPSPTKIITLYEPSPDKWEADWKTRKTT